MWAYFLFRRNSMIYFDWSILLPWTAAVATASGEGGDLRGRRSEVAATRCSSDDELRPRRAPRAAATAALRPRRAQGAVTTSVGGFYRWVSVVASWGGDERQVQAATSTSGADELRGGAGGVADADRWGGGRAGRADEGRNWRHPEREMYFSLRQVTPKLFQELYRGLQM